MLYFSVEHFRRKYFFHCTSMRVGIKNRLPVKLLTIVYCKRFCSKQHNYFYRNMLVSTTILQCKCIGYPHFGSKQLFPVAYCGCAVAINLVNLALFSPKWSADCFMPLWLYFAGNEQALATLHMAWSYVFKKFVARYKLGKRVAYVKCSLSAIWCDQLSVVIFIFPSPLASLLSMLYFFGLHIFNYVQHLGQLAKEHFM